MNWLKKLLWLQHIHQWEGTAWNAYGIEIEQRCKCGEVRHHRWMDIHDGSVEWRTGEHPGGDT